MGVRRAAPAANERPSWKGSNGCSTNFKGKEGPWFVQFWHGVGARSLGPGLPTNKAGVGLGEIRQFSIGKHCLDESRDSAVWEKQHFH